MSYGGSLGRPVASVVLSAAPTNTASITLRASTTLLIGSRITHTDHVSMSATSSMTVKLTRIPPELADSLEAVANLDPLLLGATAYLDDVFTTRLIGDTV